MYSLNKMNELLKKMLINEKSSENENQPCEIDVAFWKSEFECPICFEVRLNLDMVLKKKNLKIFLVHSLGNEASHENLAMCRWSSSLWRLLHFFSFTLIHWLWSIVRQSSVYYQIIFSHFSLSIPLAISLAIPHFFFLLRFS